MADTYYGNCSVFQSAPDHWAVKQLFPTMPIHHLEQKPTRRGVFADLTCDSDGKVDLFIDRRDVKHVLELHALDAEPYYIGIFLVGATSPRRPAQSVRRHRRGARRLGERPHRIEHLVEGDSVEEVLGYVQYSKAELVERTRRAIEAAARSASPSSRPPAPSLRAGAERLHLLEVQDSDQQIMARRSRAGSDDLKRPCRRPSPSASQRWC
jgi:arginine decarboxylase